MKKSINENNLLKNRILFYILALVVFLFFVNDYSLVTADKIAIVVAIGVDEAESEGYEVSAEVVIPPSASDESSAGSKQTVLSAKGQTIAEAVSNLFIETGWYPKLNYCNIIVLSEEIAKKGAMLVLEYFLRSETIMDSAIVVVAKDSSSKKILETSTPLDNVSAFSLQKIAFERYINYSDVVTSNLKDFTRRYYDFGSGSVLAAVSISPFDAESSKESTQSTLTGDFKLFDMTSSALFDTDRLVGFIEADQTKVYNYLKKDVVGSTFDVIGVEAPGYSDKPCDYTLEIIRQKRKVKTDIIDETLCCDVEIDLKVKISDTSGRNTSVMDITTSYELPEILEKEAAKQVEERLSLLFEKFNETNCDGLNIGKSMNAFKHNKWLGFKNAGNFKTYAKDIKYTVKVSVSGLKTAEIDQ